ncbi:hypothetical protein [Bacillus sp. REN10]|uniref:hypothetical protein n=1 Tax=Bacillus sp. REN10 TaxID=2782541 RepID=UPI00193B75A7|nr:hypothetical protein [Bacillus sp. REN10]
MNWLKVLNENEFNNLYIESDDCTVSEITSITSFQEVEFLSEIAQFIVAPYFINNIEILSNVPIMDNSIYNIVKDQIYPHFQVIQELKFEGELRSIQVKGIKETSPQKFKQIIDSKSVHPLVYEVYLKNPFKKINSPFEFPKERIMYEVIQEELINPKECFHSDSLFFFLENSYLKEKGSHLSFSPIGWELNEELKSSKTLIALSSLADKVLLIVDPDTNIVKHIELYK